MNIVKIPWRQLKPTQWVIVDAVNSWEITDLLKKTFDYDGITVGWKMLSRGEFALAFQDQTDLAYFKLMESK